MTDTTTTTTVTLTPEQADIHNRHRSVLASIPESLKDSVTTSASEVSESSPFIYTIWIREGITSFWDSGIGADGRYRLDFNLGKHYGLGKDHRIWKLKHRALFSDFKVPDTLAEGIAAYVEARATYAEKRRARQEKAEKDLSNRKAAWEAFNIPQGFVAEGLNSPWAYGFATVINGNATMDLTWSEPSEAKSVGEWRVTKATRNNPDAKALAAFLGILNPPKVDKPAKASVPANKPFKPAKGKTRKTRKAPVKA